MRILSGAWALALALLASTASADEPRQGVWMQTPAYGQIWIPAGTTTVGDAERPYAYLYTPKYGWTWYVAPWVRAVPQVYTSAGWIVAARKESPLPGVIGALLSTTQRTTTLQTIRRR